MEEGIASYPPRNAPMGFFLAAGAAGVPDGVDWRRVRVVASVLRRRRDIVFPRGCFFFDCLVVVRLFIGLASSRGAFRARISVIVALA